jgi:hypothetical protein
VTPWLPDEARAAAREAYAELAEDELAGWEVVEAMHDWAAILIGNGASLAVWDGFAYRSLFEIAQSDATESRLGEQDVGLFEGLGTTNFEAVLGELRTAALVNDVLGLDADTPMIHYESIRQSLVSAVRAVHVPWHNVPLATLRQIKRALRPYAFVFATNYDLLLYWAAMCDRPSMADFFWSTDRPLAFDPLNVDVWQMATKLLFLHGGLHLYQLLDGRAVKRVAHDYQNLLDLFGTPLEEDPGAISLFVSEGTSDSKMQAIRRSDYLTFALTQLADVRGPLVVFGHSLGDQDQHLVDIVRDPAHNTPVCISMRPADPDTIVGRKTAVTARLYPREVLFFDASTHPLGEAALAVRV